MAKYLVLRIKTGKMGYEVVVAHLTQYKEQIDDLLMAELVNHRV